MNRKVALLAVFALLLTMLPLMLAADNGSLCFYVVNGNIISFSSLWIYDGEVLIPHTVLTELNSTLGLLSQWSSDGYFTLYGDGKRLTFSYGQNIAFDGNDNQYYAVCRRSSGVQPTYNVPVSLVCEVFGFIWEGPVETDWGVMVRVRTRGLNDSQFISGRKSIIKDAFDNYIMSYQSPEPSANTPTPSASAVIPSPSAPAPTGSSPSPIQPSPAVPVPSPPVPIDEPVTIYLTFDGGVNDTTALLLDLLEQEDLPALFFLPPETLRDDPSAVRRIAACHQIGFLLEGPDGEALADTARRGNQSLREVALIKTWLARTEKAPEDPRGYRYWGSTLSFSDSDSAEDIVSAVEPLLQQKPEPDTHILSFPHSEATVEALSILAQSFVQNGVVIRRVNPGQFPFLH